jgi:hypothetical protein
MIDNDRNKDNNAEFVKQLRDRAQKKAEEYYGFLHEQERISVQLERAKTYLNKLNSFLEEEGQIPIPLKELRKGSGVGKIGNRAKDFPVRKIEWAGMTLDEIVKAILEVTPNETYHVDIIAHKIYEIQSEIDLKRVKQSLVSILKKGAHDGKWEALKRNRYKAKVVVRTQAKLVN